MAAPNPVEVIVTSVRHEADRVLSFVLADPGGDDLPPWAPGAHIDLTLPSGLVRQYSLCGDPQDLSHYRIAVLLERDSRGGSKELHTTQLCGHRLTLRGPKNHFAMGDEDKALFLAGGIGITPILPMVREQARRGGTPKLVYGGRSRQSMAFVSELRDLAIDLEIRIENESGLPDIEAIFDASSVGVPVYVCGPAGMLAAAADHARRSGREADLHLERFGAPVSPDTSNPPGSDHEFVVELRRSGLTLVVPETRGLLEVIREVLPDVPFSCEEGVCGTCETRVIDGLPDHRDLLLTESEKLSNGTMMICVGRSRSPKLVLDL